MGFEVSDELLGTFVPILVYWAYSGIYGLLGSFERYRLHSKKDEDEKNLVSKSGVVKGVILQQAIQAIVAILLFTVGLKLSCVTAFDEFPFLGFIQSPERCELDWGFACLLCLDCCL